MPKIPTLAQEITAALREWHKISKKLFVCSAVDKFPKDAGSVPDSLSAETDSQTFSIMKQMILELHECRKRVMSSNLTVEGLKELKRQVARIIDTGNKCVIKTKKLEYQYIISCIINFDFTLACSNWIWWYAMKMAMH